uniref:Tetraspanin n=1 Tax=Angiostrongylus cantonensis TaxID=6313 RepID=A0A158P971_ANGCA
MVEGGVAIVKYLLFLSNLVLWTCGLGLIILGSVLQLKFAGVLDILGDERLATPVILLVIGTLCTLLGFLGCCGAIRENYCLTVSFAVLLALVIVCEFFILVIISRRFLQTLSCCGVANSSDWSALGAIPDSCCVQARGGCARELEPLHLSGCMEKVENWILINAALVGGASAVLAGLQVVGVCFACCLSKSILKDFHDFYY